MLNQEQSYEENRNDFHEINSNIEKMGFCAIPLEKKEEDGNKEKIPFYAKLAIFLCGFAYCGFFIVQIIVALFCKNNFESKLNFEVAVISITYLVLFGIFLYFIIRYRKYFAQELKDPKKYLYGFLFGIVTIAIEIFVSYIVQSIFPTDLNGNQQSIVDYTENYPILMLFITVFVGPLCEEMTYRVGLYELIKEKNEMIAFFATSLIFAFIHISFDSTTTVQAELTSFPIYLTIAVCLTYSYKKYGFACSYVAHVFLNLISYMSITMIQA